MTLESLGMEPKDCLMIGDSHTDLEAAQANRVPIVLRWHSANTRVFATYRGPSIIDLKKP